MSAERRDWQSLWIALIVVGLSLAAHARQIPASPPPPPPAPVGFGAASPVEAPAGSGLILGQIVDAATGRPLSGVLVRIRDLAAAQPEPGGPPDSQPTPALTNAQGQFLFRDLPEGRFTLSTMLGGYLPSGYGQTRPDGPSGSVRLGLAERLTNVTIRLWKYAAITGRLLDETGEPAVGLQVRLLRRSIVGRQTQWTQAGSSQTDDRGIYRFGSLVPDEYVVAFTAGLATVPASVSEAYTRTQQSGGAVTLPPALQEASASPMGLGTRIGDLQVQPLRNTTLPPGSTGEMLAYQTVYHPSATRLSDASRIRVGPGEEKAGVDLQMKVSRTFRVSGQVFGADGQPLSAGLVLLPAEARELAQDYQFETATAVSGEDGRFVFLGVPAGDYIARMIRVPRPTISPGVVTTTMSSGGGIISFSTSGGAMDGPPTVPPDEPTLWAETPVRVTADVDDVTVSVRAGARVRGTIVLEGTGTPLEPQQRRQLSFSLAPATGRLGGIRQPPPGRLVDDDSFVTSQYPPGRYFMNVGGLFTPTWTVRSATVGGRNALEEPFDLGASDIDGMVITITAGRTELSGTVQDSAGGGAQVLVFPADYERWIANGMRTTRARTATVSADGSFQISGLPPGDYRAVALPVNAAADVEDAETIEAIASASTPVTLTAGQTRSVTLTLGSIR